MSFYRTYRPQVIDELDSPAVRTRLYELVKKDVSTLPHAYLLTGPKGVGKTTTARVIAKIFNCTKRKKDGPCGFCEQCLSIADGRNIDCMEIDAASNRGIDDIRSLREGIQLAPVSSVFKVYIIDEVHMLTTEAFNALLKTLEEPPKHAVFVLATTDPHKVPATIVSRCVTISFSKATPSELMASLSRIVKKEKIAIDEPALKEIADAADGAFRDAVKFLEQVSMAVPAGKTITKEFVQTSLTITDDKTIIQFLDCLYVLDVKTALSMIAGLTANGRDMKSFVTDILLVLQRAFISHTLGEPLFPWNENFCKELIVRFSESFTMMRTCPIPALPLELVVVEYCHSHSVEVKKSDDIPVLHEEKKSLKEEKIRPRTPSIELESDGLLTLEKLQDHWTDFIESLKPYNHSIAGVMRGGKPKSVDHGVVTIEAFYKFHQERLSEPKVRDMLCEVLKKLFGAKVKVEIVLGRR